MKVFAEESKLVLAQGSFISMHAFRELTLGLDKI